MWSQQGNKLTSTGAVGAARQGIAVALSTDSSTAMVGGYNDNSNAGTAWVFTNNQPKLQVTPTTNIAASGPVGGPFLPSSFQYQLSAPSGNINYSITGIPSWLNASFTSGTAIASPVTVTFSLTNVSSLAVGAYNAIISFTNSTYDVGSTMRPAALTVTDAAEVACITIVNPLGASPDIGDAQTALLSDPCAKPRYP